jgi:hypothetical protein
MDLGEATKGVMVRAELVALGSPAVGEEAGVLARSAAQAIVGFGPEVHLGTVEALLGHAHVVGGR